MGRTLAIHKDWNSIKGTGLYVFVEFFGFLTQIVLVGYYFVITSDIPISYSVLELIVCYALLLLTCTFHMCGIILSNGMIRLIISWIMLVPVSVFFIIDTYYLLKMTNIPISLFSFNLIACCFTLIGFIAIIKRFRM